MQYRKHLKGVAVLPDASVAEIDAAMGQLKVLRAQAVAKAAQETAAAAAANERVRMQRHDRNAAVSPLPRAHSGRMAACVGPAAAPAAAAAGDPKAVKANSAKADSAKAPEQRAHTARDPADRKPRTAGKIRRKL